MISTDPTHLDASSENIGSGQPRWPDWVVPIAASPWKRRTLWGLVFAVSIFLLTVSQSTPDLTDGEPGGSLAFALLLVVGPTLLALSGVMGYRLPKANRPLSELGWWVLTAVGAGSLGFLFALPLMRATEWWQLNSDGGGLVTVSVKTQLHALPNPLLWLCGTTLAAVLAGLGIAGVVRRARH
jgi:hypothetical protein